MVFNYLEAGVKGIAAIWHQRFMGALGYAKKFSVISPAVIVSQSPDGEWIAQLIRYLGIKAIRGSSTRGGREAMLEMIHHLIDNQAAIHAVDGPQGPKGVVKPGIIRMAQMTNGGICPVYISVNRAWIVRSWDRFLIPKPFSRILIRWGEPVFIPENSNKQTLESIRQELEKIMIEGHARDDLAWGWGKPL